MSVQGGAHIYIGPWVNWDRGLILGSTITLSSRDGGLLTAFLALFVSTAGVALWKIISYTLHQIRASRDFQDGLHHQQQLILRNVGSPASSSWELSKLFFYWWRCAERPLLRSVPLALLALCNLVLFGLAGIFSSEVTKAAGNETLIVSPDCGFFFLNETDRDTAQSAYNSRVLNGTITASGYARACYGQSQNVLECNQYVQQQLTWTTNQNASCPFSPELCVYGPTSGYEMDTGPIDSHTMLGINAPEEDRVTYRKVSTCSVIHTRNYTTEWNNTDPSDIAYGDTYQRFWYGGLPGISNYTYAYNEHAIIDNNGYTLTSLSSYARGSSNAWFPAPALNRTDADVSLFLLAPNSITYQAPVYDPFFYATLESQTPDASTDDKTNLSYWSSNYFVHAMACTDQHQYCNPGNGQCTALTGADIAIKEYTQLGMSAKQVVTAGRLAGNHMFYNMYFSVSGRGSSALRATETVYDLSQMPLPDTQWMIEINSWFAVGMARLQQLVVEFATGPHLQAGAYIMKPADSTAEHMCYAQKVRSGAGILSFSVLGVAIILVLGAILIFISFTLDVVVGFIQRKMNKGDYKRVQWQVDEKLQMQRLAYEEAGMGTWTGGASAVPTTLKGDRFGVPEEVDKEHVRLGNGRHRREGSETGGSAEAQSLMGTDKDAFRVQTVTL